MPGSNRGLAVVSPSAGQGAPAAASPSFKPAALARLIFQGQTQAATIPRLAGIPASYSSNPGSGIGLRAAQDFARLGLGSLQMWRRHRGNVAAFLAEALKAWLVEQGAGELREVTGLDLDLCDQVEGLHEPGTLYAVIESSSCGRIELGDALRALENQAAGLGQAYYRVLLRTLHRWVYTYDYANAEAQVEGMRECIEADLEEGEEFEEHCRANGIELPDPGGAMPGFLRQDKLGRHACRRLLKAHRSGPFGEWIEVLLVAARKRSRCQTDLAQLDTSWDDAPLPAWLLVMQTQDAIEQCFDEEAQTMYESNHEPSCFIRYEPGNAGSLRAMLAELARFVAVNRAVAHIGALIGAWRKDHAGKCDHRAVA